MLRVIWGHQTHCYLDMLRGLSYGGTEFAAILTFSYGGIDFYCASQFTQISWKGLQSQGLGANSTIEVVADPFRVPGASLSPLPPPHPAHTHTSRSYPWGQER